MSDVGLNESTPAEAVVSAAPVTAGSLLRAAREASGLHIAALSVAMKVPVKKLEALEADRADLLPDIVFVRALASSVCRTLKVDPAPILELLPQTVQATLETTHKGINEPFKVPGEARHINWLDALKRPSVQIVVGLLVAALVVFFMPEIHWAETVIKQETTEASTQTSKAPPGDAAVTEKAEDKLPVVEVVPAPVPAVAASAPAPVIAVAEAAAPSDKPVEMIVIRSKGVAWVEVVDASGAVQVRRTLQAGGVTSANGVLPLSVVIGKADVVDVEVKGKPFGLSGISKDNVARFEVKQ